MSIEVILEIGELYRRDRAIVKKRGEHFEFVRTDRAPLGGRALEVKNIFFAVREAEEMVFVLLLDRKVCLHGEVDERRRDVTHRGFVIDERAAFAGSELIRWLVLHGDGAALGVSATRPPEPQHDEKRDDGEKERPIATKEESDFRRGGGRVNESLVQSHDDCETFAI